jgi:hypothetical protein
MSLLPAKRKILCLLLRDLTPIRIRINVTTHTLLHIMIHLPLGSPSCSPHGFQWRRDIRCGHLKMLCLGWTWLWRCLGPLILEMPPHLGSHKRGLILSILNVICEGPYLNYNYFTTFVRPFNFNIKLLKFSVF